MLLYQHPPLPSTLHASVVQQLWVFVRGSTLLFALLLVQVCWRGGRIVPVTQPGACCLSSSVCVSCVEPGAALPWCKLWSAGVLLAAPAPFWSHSWWCWKGSACGMDALVTITPGAEQLSWNHEGRPLFAGGYCHCLGGTWCSMIVYLRAYGTW